MESGVQKGFTLYELLVTVLVAGIIFGFGIPNLLEFSRNGRMTAAVTREAPVTLCASADPVAPLPTCSADGSVTSGGYFVWIDSNNDAVADADEDIVLQRPGHDGISTYSDSGYIHFGPNGFVADIPSEGSAASVILFCDARGNVMVVGGQSAARALRVPRTGRPAMLSTVGDIIPLSLDCP
jgi:prepilin-type N-terminal cleavage/methylation domain-containing protein